MPRRQWWHLLPSFPKCFTIEIVSSREQFGDAIPIH